MTLPFRRRHHDDEGPHDRARALTSHEMLDPLAADDATWLARHLDACAECRREREALLADRSLLRTLRDATPEPPRDLWARTSAALDRESRARRSRGASERVGAERGAGWGFRGLPLGAAAGVLIVIVVLGASLVPPTNPLSTAPSGTGVAVASPEVQPTPFQVTAGRVGWIRTAGDGSWELVITDVDAVCPRAKPGCRPLGADDPGRPVDLGGAPTGVTISPTELQLVFESRGEGATPDRILIVPVPAASPQVTPPTETSAPGSAPPETPEPTTGGTPRDAIEIASGVVVVGEAAYSADGLWLAFSARPSDGSTGPDLYLWTAGQLTATQVTSDHQTYFSSWFGGQVLASRIAVVPGEEPDATGVPASDATDAPSGTPDASPAAPVEGHASSFLLDPATLVETPIAQPDVWLPVVDPTGRFVAYWSGTLVDVPGTHDWALGTGQLALAGWSNAAVAASETPALATADPAATGDPAATSAPAVGPSGPMVALVPGVIATFKAKFDPTGTRLAVWVGEQLDATIGRLHLIVLDRDTGSINSSLTPLPGVPALGRFSIDAGRLAWVSPSGQDGQESAVQVLGWSNDEFGEIRTVPAKDLYIVR